MPTAPSLTLPPAPEPLRRGAMPLAAAAIPVGGAVVMWLVTSSPFALWFAALGPLMALASFLDAHRARRRERRATAAKRDRLIAGIRSRIAEAHAQERAEADARHPDVAAYAAAQAEVWRRVPGRAGLLVVGRGEARSTVRVAGDDEDAAALRREAERLGDAPVVVPAEAGIAVVGPEPFATAVVRGLALQLRCQRPPGESVAGDEPTAIPAGVAPPPACAAVLTLVAPDRAVLDHDGVVREVRVEAVAESQHDAFLELLARRAQDLAPASRLPSELWRDGLPGPRRGGLAAVVGAGPDGPYELDLVADGPHAVVAGTTGTGKSEFLVTWVAAMAAARGPEQVTFVLIDFKGGTAFRRLARLPHVTGILTDLDDRATRRAVEALRAEIRRRETELAAVGASDVDHPAARLSRLVVVVDEFGALLQQAPDLASVFTDVAARGRGLGIHLVLGSQRTIGVVRDAILANCPLRVGLRLTDAADSRHLLGAEDAAAESERGVARVRTAADAALSVVRVARTTDDDIAALADGAREGPSPSAVWLPPLPSRLPVAQAGAGGDGIVLGLADEPERQRQRQVVLTPHDTGLVVVGGPASGRSALLGAIAEQDPGAVVLPRDPEAAWDLTGALLEAPPAPGTLLLCDDLDLLATRLPPDYAAALVERMVELARGSGMRPVVACGRPLGALARVVDLCSRRALLRMPTRLDHVGVGGDPATHDPDAPRGRGVLDGLPVQFVEGASGASPPSDRIPLWQPRAGLAIAVVAGPAAVGRLSAALDQAGIAVGGPSDPAEAGDGPRVLVGDTDGWQRVWSRFTALRGEAALMIAADCAADYRLLTGARSLPPYCAPGRGRGWLVADGRPARRILLPGTAERRPRALG